MSDNEDIAAAAPQPTQAEASRKDLKLRTLWLESPASWFLYVTASFAYVKSLWKLTSSAILWLLFLGRAFGWS
jgi:hypothetical protein